MNTPTSEERLAQFETFKECIRIKLLSHPVITDNKYTAWFARGELSLAQVQDLFQQFSVFSLLFLVAQLKKFIYAPNEATRKAAWEILVSELGGDFCPQETSVDGSSIYFDHAHYQWLLVTASHFGLNESDLGVRHARGSTLHFCATLERLYGSQNYTVAHAASYAVENWAVAGFWKELISGLRIFNGKRGVQSTITFFVDHDRVEDSHAWHTQQELKEFYLSEDSIDEDLFIRTGIEMLDAVKIFWDGLAK